jgi:hypothetical protein
MTVMADECPRLDAAADGGVFFVVPTTDDEVASLRTTNTTGAGLSAEPVWAKAPSDGKPTVYVLPKKRGRVAEYVMDLAACQEVRALEPRLLDDGVARNALDTRIDDLHAQLEAEVARLFDPGDSDWWFSGVALDVRSHTDVAKALSVLCDKQYTASPTILNELLNRRKVSSTAARARRVLLNAVMMEADQERLSIEGSGPEYSMYLSLLKKLGFHVKSKGKWQFSMPKEHCQQLCTTFDEFLQETEAGKQPISHLYERLRQPPFGIKDGPLPLIVMALFQARRADVAFIDTTRFFGSGEMLRMSCFSKNQRCLPYGHFG